MHDLFHIQSAVHAESPKILVQLTFTLLNSEDEVVSIRKLVKEFHMLVMQ